MGEWGNGGRKVEEVWGGREMKDGRREKEEVWGGGKEG